MLRHVSNTETLASSDKQVIEELRHDLRTNKINEAGKSVLEAIGNPEVMLYLKRRTIYLQISNCIRDNLLVP